MFISLLQWKVFGFLLKLFLEHPKTKWGGGGEKRLFVILALTELICFLLLKTPIKQKKTNKAQPHYSEAFFSSLFKKRVQYWVGAAQCFSNEASEADLFLPRRKTMWLPRTVKYLLNFICVNGWGILNIFYSASGNA